MVKTFIFRKLAHLIFRTGGYKNRSIKEFSKKIKNKKILELGSGKKYRGKYCYSVKQFFDNSNEFIQSDIVQEYGHKIIDATQMNYKNEFDIILCINVLEHVFNFHRAIINIYNALKPNGTAIIFVPGFYPLHGEPNDYWRFTEHSLKKLLKDFRNVKIKHSGIQQYPFAYCIKAVK